MLILPLTTQIIAQSSPNGGTRSIGFLKATTPFARIDRVVLIQIAGVDERFDAAFVLVMLQIVQLLGGQLAVIVQIQMTKHPACLQFAGGREVNLVLLLLVLAAFLAVGHYHREPVQESIANRG